MFTHSHGPINACIFGASGGIGAAVTAALAKEPSVDHILAGARRVDHIIQHPKIERFAFDLCNEQSIAAAAEMAEKQQSLNLIIIATGLLHDGDNLQPERAARMQSSENYERAFAVNAIGPALIGKHFLPVMSRNGRAVFVALSARVGSVEDNRLGGWHSYRASKAALNMIVRNFAIELTGRNRDAVAITYHPGTVETPLSAPFGKGRTSSATFTPEYAAERLLAVIDSVQSEDTGKLIGWDGRPIPF